MTWERKPLLPPFHPELVNIVSGLSQLGTNVGAVLTIAEDLLDVAKVFYFLKGDPYKVLVSAIILELEDLINDLFSVGVYQLVVDPFTMVMHGKRYDRWGIPIVTPGDAINAVIASFDDEGDPDRPLFSASEEISALGIMVTTPSYGEFVSLLQGLWNVFKVDDILFLINKLDRYKNGRDERSRLPDWDKISLNSIEPLAQTQSIILDTLATVKGYIVVTDEIITKLIDVISYKLETIGELIDILNILILNLETIASFNQAYIFELPKGSGGTDRLITEIADPVLMANRFNQYTAMYLTVGGGEAGAHTVQTLIDIMS